LCTKSSKEDLIQYLQCRSWVDTPWNKVKRSDTTLPAPRGR
jgi:hypothetical protein